MINAGQNMALLRILFWGFSKRFVENQLDKIKILSSSSLPVSHALSLPTLSAVHFLRLHPPG
jgi:hypothetical protein